MIDAIAAPSAGQAGHGHGAGEPGDQGPLRAVERYRRVRIGPAAAMLGRAVLFQKRVVGEPLREAGVPIDHSEYPDLPIMARRGRDGQSGHVTSGNL